MKIFDVKVNIAGIKNSYMILPQKLTKLFVQEGRDAVLLFLPFRYSALIKSLGISKEDFDTYFEKSGMSCTLITMGQFETLVQDIRKKYPQAKDRANMLRYFGAHASQSSTGKFAVPFTERSKFVNGTYKIIALYDETTGRVCSEVIEEENIKKLSKIRKKSTLQLNAPTKSKGRTK